MRLLRMWLFGALCLVAAACETAEPGSGSNTNWLRSCAFDAECGGKLACVCGVCAAPCSDTCASLPNAVCVPSSSPRAQLLCGPESDATGVCLPSCVDDSDCGKGQLCEEGTCLKLGSADGCVAGSSLELTPSKTTLLARYGTIFSDALYLPVAYPAQPSDWSEPAPPTPIVARVTGPDGKPVRDCAVKLVVADGSGAAFPTTAATDAKGELRAYWVAGAERHQSLTAALVDEDGAVQARTIGGSAYANDQGPQSMDAAASVTTRPSTLRLHYDLPPGASKLRVALSGASYPHHAFHAVFSTTGFFAGLQNTGDRDADSSDVPDAERVLIASVWNTDTVQAEQLYAKDGTDCSPHDQQTGGIHCFLPGAWQPGHDYWLELARTRLAMGEAGPDYAALGLPTAPCASADGCTDYTLSFAELQGSLEPIVTYRYPSADIEDGFGSFLQPFDDAPEQTSCLDTPEYAVDLQPSFDAGDGYVPIRSADFSVAYASWDGEVCANYAATGTSSGFRLRTGGSRPLGAPLLPDEPARVIGLP